MSERVRESVFNIPPTAEGIMETGPHLRVSSNSLEESGIELGPLGTRYVIYPLHQGSSDSKYGYV